MYNNYNLYCIITFVIVIFFPLLFHTHAVAPPTFTCHGPEVSLYKNQTFTQNGIETVTGTVGVCQNGILVGYCDDGSIFGGAAQYFCNALGYLCKLSSFLNVIFYFIYFLMFEPIFILSCLSFVSLCLLSSSLPQLDSQQVQLLGPGLPSGAIYLTNFSCLSTPYGPSDCTNGVPTNNPACYNGVLDYSVTCLGRQARK